MRIQRFWIPPVSMFAVLAGVALSLTAPTYAQYPPGYGPAGGAYGHPGYTTAGPRDYAYAPSVQPAAYDMSLNAPPQPFPAPASAIDGGYGDYYSEGDMGGCQSCSGGGCGACGGSGFAGGDGVFLSALRRLAPYGEGGCCAQRWFDIHAEAMILTREEVARNQIDFASFTVGGPTVLDTEDLDFNEEAGFRVVAAMQVGPGSSIEGNYFGTHNWSDSAVVVDATDSLFSPFSDFGTNPLNGFLETDAAGVAGIAYSSTIDSIEMNFRRRWVGANCRLQGSWLVGARFFKLDEDFVYFTAVDRPDPPNPNIVASMRNLTATRNSLTGFQMGGDAWVCIVPGLSVGAEVKAGIYGTRAEQNTFIDLAGGVPVNYFEEAAVEEAALVAEAGLMGIWRVNQHWTIRAGYQMLFVDGVALAPENFNSDPPFVNVPPQRPAFVNANGNVFYHGLTIGGEWMW